MFQSPSHRGGGAAPLRFRRSSPRSLGFNPLRIGEAAPPVDSESDDSVAMTLFQSPSHRGGGAAMLLGGGLIGFGLMFQSPSHRGGGAAPNIQLVRSSPGLLVFQSPSHRGGGAARKSIFLRRLQRGRTFQSPSHRGGGAATGSLESAAIEQSVSIPFASGRRRRHTLMLATGAKPKGTGFNPLRIGEAAPPIRI